MVPTQTAYTTRTVGQELHRITAGRYISGRPTELRSKPRLFFSYNLSPSRSRQCGQIGGVKAFTSVQTWDPDNYSIQTPPAGTDRRRPELLDVKGDGQDRGIEPTPDVTASCRWTQPTPGGCLGP